MKKSLQCFKPYYKWNTFNTVKEAYKKAKDTCFKPYYKWNTFNTDLGFMTSYSNSFGFKPYYKWNTFNTTNYSRIEKKHNKVLNLIINGIPSIPGSAWVKVKY